MSSIYITYQLSIKINEDITIEIGKLGTYTIKAGNYVYTGSAKRNFEARINRHLSKNKKLKWHIDYILNHPVVSIYDVLRSNIPECTLNQQTRGEIVIPKLGSSDCKNGCGSHFKRTG